MTKHQSSYNLLVALSRGAICSVTINQSTSSTSSCPAIPLSTFIPRECGANLQAGNEFASRGGETRFAGPKNDSSQVRNRIYETDDFFQVLRSLIAGRFGLVRDRVFAGDQH